MRWVSLAFVSLSALSLRYAIVYALLTVGFGLNSSHFLANLFDHPFFFNVVNQNFSFFFSRFISFSDFWPLLYHSQYLFLALKEHSCGFFVVFVVLVDL